MKYTFVLAVWAVLCHACAVRHRRLDGSGDPRTGYSGEGVLHLHCTFTAPYCGGAYPLENDLPRTHPWSGRMFIRSAMPDSTGRFAFNRLEEPVIDTVRMNGEGHGWLRLPAGAYLVLEEERMDRTRHDRLLEDHRDPALYTTPIDTACMRRWLHGPFPVHTITEGDTLHMELPMHGQCPWYATPCVSYLGPLPP